MEPSSQRELHDALWRSSGGFDLVLAPVLLSLFGLWLDNRLGTTPIVMIALLLFGAIGATCKVYYDWKRGMSAAVAERDRLLAETDALREAVRS